jgi:MerR family transcriptional regulator, repressor of the yfmOP operon
VIRIGEVAERVGITPRTIRYYEEIGLLPGGERPKGTHRLYDDADVERLTELTRLRDLLNLSLEELKELVEAEEARAVLRRRFASADSETERLDIVEAAQPIVERQLELVRRRKRELERLEAELVDKRRRLQARRRELSARPVPASTSPTRAR